MKVVIKLKTLTGTDWIGEVSDGWHSQGYKVDPSSPVAWDVIRVNNKTWFSAGQGRGGLWVLETPEEIYKLIKAAQEDE